MACRDPIPIVAKEVGTGTCVKHYTAAITTGRTAYTKNATACGGFSNWPFTAGTVRLLVHDTP